RGGGLRLRGRVQPGVQESDRARPRGLARGPSHRPIVVPSTSARSRYAGAGSRDDKSLADALPPGRMSGRDEGTAPSSSTRGRQEMRTITAGMLALAAVAGAACNDHPTAPAGPSYSASRLAAASTAAGARQGFGFNGTVSGFPTGAVFLTGVGSFDAA